MYLKALLIFSALLLVVDAEVAYRIIALDGAYLRGVYLSSVNRERAQKEEALKAAHLITEMNARSVQIALKHSELREEYKKAARDRAGGAQVPGEDNSRINGIRGLLSLESEAFKRSLDRLGEFHYGKVPKKPRRILESLPLMSEKERVRSSGEHLMKGIRYFQSEDLEGAIKMWEAAVELDPGNKTAAEYKKRAETILERLNEIKAEKGQQAPAPATRPSF